ncbi:hypothetical protein JHN63_03110 [Streptomyces sp. MBT65]|uniref:TetR family transcriptional regulator C-terminal domain-containing protein n=1 Tax=Streptomyces sp. MBT65 TaxID=1488395 RepID=UPI00190AAC8B|nr:hypothetical protein [Streptomyces sp. MBT65]MBK3572829.1 hypothetical protein [Streptomyces sp. MBT65]
MPGVQLRVSDLRGPERHRYLHHGRLSGAAWLVQLSHVLAAESGGGDHPAAEYSRRHFMEARTLVRTALEAGIADGELREDLDCGLLATQIVAVMEGLENQWPADPGQVDLVGVFHAYTRDLREWIRATP